MGVTLKLSTRRQTLQVTVTALLGGAVALVFLGLLAVFTGLIPANADARPSALERWAATTSLHATLARATRGLADPLQANDRTLVEGVRLYGNNCAVCHGAADGKPSSVARGLYQKPPQFKKDDVTDDPVAVIYWKITHGIRLTGMPAFNESLKDNERWAVAEFLKQQNELPPNAEAAWRKLPSAVTDTTM